MKRSRSNVVFIKLDQPEYDFIFNDIAKSGKTLKGFIQMLIRELQAKRAQDDKSRY